MTELQIVIINPDVMDAVERLGKQAFADGMLLLAARLEGYMKDEAPTGVSSDLKRDITSEKMGSSWDAAWRVYSPQNYALAVEEGSRPHAAPFEAIRHWAEHKGLDPGAVWWHIYHYGTKANPFARRAMDKLTSEGIGNVLSAYMGQSVAMRARFNS